jgi:hypothetical protein
MCAKRSRFVKSLIAVFGMLILLTSPPATAQQGGKRSGPGGPGRQMAPQQVPARDTELQHRGAPHDKRMTPEQRRQLRRDVHNHGRDIYRDRPAPKP